MFLLFNLFRVHITEYTQFMIIVLPTAILVIQNANYAAGLFGQGPYKTNVLLSGLVFKLNNINRKKKKICAHCFSCCLCNDTDKTQHHKLLAQVLSDSQ